MTSTDQAVSRRFSDRPVSEMRYTVSVRTDAAHGLETVLQKSSSALISLKAPAPWGPCGFDVTSIERQPRDGMPGPVQVWDASTESAARAETRAALRERAEFYTGKAAEFIGAGESVGAEGRWYVAMYRTVADELRKVAASL